MAIVYSPKDLSIALANGDVKQYAFTWNPDPKKFMNNEAYFIKDLLEEHMKYLRMLYKRTYICEIYPELSSAGKLHYHGIIIPHMLDNEIHVSYFKALMALKRKGFTCIKQIINPKSYARWNSYCRKSVSTMEAMLNITLPLKMLEHYNDLKELRTEANIIDVMDALVDGDESEIEDDLKIQF